jgi:radical SAM superfamily enzyme YgiQ (UPF0313 family)
MKILLINPPRSPENNILKFAPVEAQKFIHRKLIGPPLGLLTIAEAVKEYDVTVFDMKGEYDLNADAPPPYQLVKELMDLYRPDVVGVTTITSEFDYSREICRVVKSVDNSVVTVAGGLHATLCPGDFTDRAFNIIIPGQCPHIFRKLIRTIDSGGTLDSVEGIFINDDYGLRKTRGHADPWDAAGEHFLFPNRRHLDRWISTYKVGNSPDPSTYVFTSLGCPYKCTFCSIWTQFKGNYYQRTIGSLIDELKQIDEYPVVRFADANSVVDEEFMLQLFDRISEEGIKKTFVMDIRADVAARRPDVIARLAKGGLKVVICGFESFRDEELKKYRKESPAFMNSDAVRVFEDNGIMVRGNYVIPPDYGKADFEALAEYSGLNPVVYAGYTILTPMPGTVYHKQVKDKIIDWDYKKYNFFNSVMQTRLDHDEFHFMVGSLWLIKKGTDVI